MNTRLGLRGHRVQNSERAEARRRDILVAAARVFARDGYAAASLDDIGEQLGVSKGVIYYYFRSKEAIYTEIATTASREASQRLETIVAQGDPPDVALRAAISNLVSHIFDDLDRYSITMRTGERLSPESLALIRAQGRRYEQLLRGIIVDGIRAGLFVDHDPTLTTFTILRACLGIADWYSPNGRLTPQAIVQQVTEQMIGGVLRRPEAPLN
ncbi:MAG: TetR/AcrR family transcriptional regulator [Dehalococcoidia bacterium]